jgi:hypothetical protein
MYAAFYITGGVCWAWAALAYQRDTGARCRRCGRAASRVDTTAPESSVRRQVVPPSPLQRRITVTAAVIPAIGFTIPHWLWALGVPFGALDAEEMRESSALALLMLGVFPLLGAGLTIGLISSWGQVFARWIPIAGGRHVPRWLATVPPAVLGLMLAQYGAMMTRCTSATLLHITDACYGYGRDYFAANWAFTATYPIFWSWGATLFAAAIGYFLTTRPFCTVCKRR